MTLIKTSFLNGLAVIVKILTLLGINKLLAVYVGPAGYAALGQFQNAMTMITTFASGAITTGVTKYTAEYYQDEQAQQQIWKTAGTIALTGSLVSSLLIIIFAKPLANWFLKDAAYAGVFICFALTLVFFVFNALLLAILNGKKEIGRYVIANIAGSLFALIITSILAVWFGLYGTLIALAVFQSVAFFVTLLLCYRAHWFKLSYLFGTFDKTVAKKLFNYTLMALSSAICVPISHIFIRKHLGDTLGWNVAGYWEAMWRLSAAYLMLVTTTLSVYYLPRLSEIKNAVELKKEIMQGYRIILPVAIVSAILMYYARHWIITLLFSPEFAPISELFFGQVIGDVLKIGSWIMAFLMLSKAMTSYFVITEVLFSASFYFVMVFMTNTWGFAGIPWAYVLNYLVYWIVMYFLVFKTIKNGITLCTPTSAI